jgi:formate-dependent nitrite reductase membrane component NrfD
MDQLAQYYRIGLFEAIILLLLFLLAFGSLTVISRDRWLTLGTTESLLARLAAAVLLASIAVGGLSGVILNLVQGSAFSDNTISPVAARNQAVLGIGLALAVTIVGIIRIEMYHRRLVSPPTQEEDADWKVEPPEVAGRR